MVFSAFVARSRSQAFGIANLFTRILWLNEVNKQRRALAKLDDSALKDLGLSPSDVAKELERPVWDAPHHWKR